MHKNIIILSLFGVGLLLFFIAILSVFAGLGGEEGIFIIRFGHEGQADISGTLGAVSGIFTVIFLMIAVNGAVAWRAYEREGFLSYMLGATTVAIGLASLAVALSVITAN